MPQHQLTISAEQEILSRCRASTTHAHLVSPLLAASLWPSPPDAGNTVLMRSISILYIRIGLFVLQFCSF